MADPPLLIYSCSSHFGEKNAIPAALIKYVVFQHELREINDACTSRQDDTVGLQLNVMHWLVLEDCQCRGSAFGLLLTCI